MGVLSKLAGNGISNAIKPITDLADKFIVDKDKKMQYEQELAVLKINAESEILKSQKEITTEALKNNTVPVKSFVYVFLGMMLFNFIVAVIIQFFPNFNYKEVLIPDSLSTIIITIIGGIFGKEALITGRDTVVNNFNRKKIDSIDSSRFIIKCLNDGKTFNTVGETAIFYNIKQTEVLQVIEGKKDDIGGMIFIKTIEE